MKKVHLFTTRTLFLITTMILVFIVVFSWHAYCFFYQPLISKETSAVVITLDRTASAHQFVRTLQQKKLIQSSSMLLLMIRIEGLASRLKAGVYQIKPGESANQLLGRVVGGDVVVQPFTIIAGTTQSKIDSDLKLATYLELSPNAWAAIKGNYPNAEGLVLADTYQYRGGSTSKSLLEHAHQHLMTYLADSWVNRDIDLPYKSPYELLTAASIIEKETAIPTERKLISGVMANRLKKRMPLQMDPTVIYGLGSDYKGKLSHNDLLIDSPYNTYRYRGLPPTPIAMVGKEAIDAAAHPQLSNYLYFVAKGDGTHQFSETYEQQKQAINLYQRKDM